MEPNNEQQALQYIAQVMTEYSKMLPISVQSLFIQQADMCLKTIQSAIKE